LGFSPSAGPEVTILYCRPSGRVVTTGSLAFLARKAALALVSAALGGALWQAAIDRARTATTARRRNIRNFLSALKSPLGGSALKTQRRSRSDSANHYTARGGYPAARSASMISWVCWASRVSIITSNSAP